MEEIKNIIAEAHFKDIELIQPAPLIKICGRTVATEGNFITISGLPKSRKTTFAFIAAAAALLKHPIFDIEVNLSDSENILLIDTEQSIFDFARQIKLLKYFIGSDKLPENFNAYLFRKYEPKQILESLYALMLEKKPKIVILDNLTELVLNPNDVIESKTIIQFLKRITAEFNCVVICLLHLGKSSGSTLGNLGSYADRGAQSTLKVTKDADTQISYLEASFLRSDAHFNPLGIFYNEDLKKYERTDEIQSTKPTKKTSFEALTEADHKAKLNLIFTATEITYSELVEEIKRFYGVGTNLSKQKILPFLLGNNFLINNKGIYKLNF
jgi:hypothetical protein